jgi:glutamine amidotransferase
MIKPEVVVIDYGVGNLLSVQRGLEHCGAKVTLTAEPGKILAAKRVVLPGVGAFGNAMEALHNLDLVEVIRELANKKIALLGICLGMQLLLEESEEFGLTAGLGLIPGRVLPIPKRTELGEIQKIPHIGWSSLQLSDGLNGWNGTLLQHNHPGESAYFVHSFMAVPTDPNHRIADCEYGGRSIAAVIRREHITGCQFHPEKSGDVGLKMLRRFCLD